MSNQIDIVVPDFLLQVPTNKSPRLSELFSVIRGIFGLPHSFNKICDVNVNTHFQKCVDRRIYVSENFYYVNLYVKLVEELNFFVIDPGTVYNTTL